MTATTRHAEGVLRIILILTGLFLIFSACLPLYRALAASPDDQIQVQHNRNGIGDPRPHPNYATAIVAAAAAVLHVRSARRITRHAVARRPAYAPRAGARGAGAT